MEGGKIASKEIYIVRKYISEAIVLVLLPRLLHFPVCLYCGREKAFQARLSRYLDVAGKSSLSFFFLVQ